MYSQKKYSFVKEDLVRVVGSGVRAQHLSGLCVELADRASKAECDIQPFAVGNQGPRQLLRLGEAAAVAAVSAEAVQGQWMITPGLPAPRCKR